MDEKEHNSNNDAQLHAPPRAQAHPLPAFQQNSPQNEFGQQPPLHRNNPLLLRIHADDQDKKTVCIFWIVLFIFILLLAILANVAVPDLYVAVQHSDLLAGTNLAGCDNPSAFSESEVVCSTFLPNITVGEMVSGWGPVNQVGLIYLQVTPANMSSFIYQDYTLQLYTLISYYSQTDSTYHLKKKSLDASITTTISLSSSDATFLYANDGKTVVGYTQLMAAITKLKDNSPFLLRVIFTDAKDFQPIARVALQSYAINPQFTYYTIIVRYVFFGLSILSLVLYLIRYVKIPADQKVFEQRIIAGLSILLLMFNDPFYPITVLKPNGGSAFFSVLFVVNMVVALIFLWVVMADRISFQDGLRTTEECTKKKIAYVAVVWIEMIVSLMVYTMYQIQEVPIVPYSFLNRFKFAQAIIAFTVLFGFGYVAHRYCQVCSAPESKLWRNSIFMVFSCIFIVALFIIIVSNSLILFNYKGSSILMVYGLVNIYVYYLQYMYSITREESFKLEGGDGKDGNWGNGGVPEEDNYDVLTVGTIDIVDVNLDSPGKNRNQRKSYELAQKQMESEIEVSKNKQAQFQSYESD